MYLKETSLSLIKQGIKAADPYTRVKDNVSLQDDKLKINDKFFDLKNYSEIFVAGIGKAAGRMALALEEIIEPSEGVVITNARDVSLESIELLCASHPIPEQNNVRASCELFQLAKKAGENTLFIFLISGGGSALFCLPGGNLTLRDLQKTTNLLLDAGANIQEINAVRKHLSKVKGGRFAEEVNPADLVSVILSDVVGDDLGTIASGPTCRDDTTFDESFEVLKKYELCSSVPPPVLTRLENGRAGAIKENPKEETSGTWNFLIGNNLTALTAVKKKAEKMGYHALLLSSSVEGEAKIVGFVHAAIAKEIQDSGAPLDPPAVIISGGETTVRLENARGNGGPNREFVLGTATKIQKRKNIMVSAVDTDGVDGIGKTGAYADGSTISRMNKPASHYFLNHDTETCFDQLGDSIDLGKTSTNVNDLRIIVVDE